MTDYRRGVVNMRKNDLWHWHEECASYPTRAFIRRGDRPPDDELCGRCAAFPGVPPGRL